MKPVHLIGGLASVWLAGFGIFVATLPGPLDDRRTDAIVVPTGAAGRIDRGLALLERHAARRMLVTGVAPEVTERDLARQYHSPLAVFACCVDLGREAVDTYSNADEAAAWIRRHRYRSVRLVTSSWHLPRARLELGNKLGQGVVVRGDGVPSWPRFGLLISEYNKFLIRTVAVACGIGS